MKRELLFSVIRFFIAVLVFGSLLIGLVSRWLVPSWFPRFQVIFYMVYLVFEHIVRGILIIGGALIVYALTRGVQKKASMRRMSVLGFSISALILLCILPVASGFWEYYNVLMPFPWSTFPLQLLYDGHFFSTDLQSPFGESGVFLLLSLYGVFNAAVFVVVILFGRRFFCSMICMNFGAHAETLKEGFPLFGSRDRMKHNLMPKMKTTLYTAKWMFLVANLILILLWAALLAGADIEAASLRTVELMKYMIFELFFVLFAFAALSGRTYCYYCPAGTAISLVGRVTGHCIRTDRGACIGCGRCNEACDMQIDIRAHAERGKTVNSLLCVGCGACVDACPADALEYR